MGREIINEYLPHMNVVDCALGLLVPYVIASMLAWIVYADNAVKGGLASATAS